MSAPTVADRLRPRAILLSRDADLAQRIQATLPPDWALRVTDSLEALGEWQEILLHRFVLLDLDEAEAFDPRRVIETLRRDYQLNIAVFCFGGSPALRDEMRMARADRFFDRAEILDRLPQIVEQYSWG